LNVFGHNSGSLFQTVYGAQKKVYETGMKKRKGYEIQKKAICH
jgi:hypothetical protein